MCHDAGGNLVVLAAVVLVLPAIAACASNPAPDGWLPAADEVQTEPYGAWIELATSPGSGSRVLSGELLAVHEDSVFVIANGRLEAVSVAEMQEARVAWFDSQSGLLVLWTGIGSLSTLSHGWYASISLPLWILGGTIATAAQSRTPLVDYEPEAGRVERLRPYARFPQGLPPAVDRARLRGKPK